MHSIETGAFVHRIEAKYISVGDVFIFGVSLHKVLSLTSDGTFVHFTTHRNGHDQEEYDFSSRSSKRKEFKVSVLLNELREVLDF